MSNMTVSALQPLLMFVIDQLANSRSPPRITTHILVLMATIFQCQWATYWRVQSDTARLYPEVIWNHELVNTHYLERDTRGRLLALNEGTAGHVWRKRTPVWTTNLGLDMCLPRSTDAQKAGLTGGLWFALGTDAAVYGVVELLSLNIMPPSKELLESVEEFGKSIGHLLEAE